MATVKKSAAASARPAPRAPGIRISPRDLLQMVRDRFLFGLLFSAAVVAAFIYFQPKIIPTYTTEATLLFERKARLLNVQDVVDMDYDLNTQMEQIRSTSFLKYVITSFTPEEEKKIEEAYRDPSQPNLPLPSLASIIQGNYSVGVRRGAAIIGITVTNRDPECAKLIADRFARRYIDYSLDRAATVTNSAMVMLRQQSADMRDQVEAAETALQTYRAKNNIAALGQNQNVVLQKVSSVGSTLVKEQMEEVELSNILQKVADDQKQGKDLLELDAIRSYVGELANKLVELKAQRAQMEQIYGPAWPDMVSNQLAIDETTRRIADKTREGVAALQTRETVLNQYIARLKVELAEAQIKVHELDKVSVDYNLLEQEAATKHAAYAAIVNRLNEAQIASQMESPNIRLFDPAWVPGSPGISNVVKLGTEGIGLAVFSLLGFTIVLGFLDTRIKTASHVEAVLGETLLGVVKSIKDLKSTERAHAFRLHKDEALEESYRGIYSELDIRSRSPFPKALLVTSAMPGDGKSLTASNLAAVFAAHGRNTILVDCDLRRPGVHRAFGADGSNGWTQWALSNKPSSERGALPAVPIAENLSILPAGSQPKNPTEVLDRIVSSGLLKYLRQQYDLVILDTPPVAVFPDALLLARHCEELVYVCRFGAVRINVVRRTLERLAETEVHVRGIVLNNMPGSRLNHYGYESYGSYRKRYYEAYAKGSKGA